VVAPTALAALFADWLSGYELQLFVTLEKETCPGCGMLD